MDTSDLMICDSCGSVVGSESVHQSWHARLRAAEVLAGAAIEIADRTAHVVAEHDCET